MDPATIAAISTLWKVGGVVAVALAFTIWAVIGMWNANKARELRMAVALDKQMEACATREKVLGDRLESVEREFRNFQSTIASESINVAATAASAIDNQARITERILAHLERKS